MKTYNVTIKKQGSEMRVTQLSAPCALTAINKVLAQMGVTPRTIVIDGKSYAFTGYDAEAREMVA